MNAKWISDKDPEKGDQILARWIEFGYSTTGPYIANISYMSFYFDENSPGGFESWILIEDLVEVIEESEITKKDDTLKRIKETLDDEFIKTQPIFRQLK